MKLSPPRTSRRVLAILLAAGAIFGACTVCAVVIVARAVASGSGYEVRHILAARLAWVRNMGQVGR